MAKELDVRNHEVTLKIARVLNELKDFEAATSPDPKLGRMIVKFKDHVFFMDLDPIYQDTASGRESENLPFDDICRKNQYYLRK